MAIANKFALCFLYFVKEQYESSLLLIESVSNFTSQGLSLVLLQGIPTESPSGSLSDCHI